MKRLRLFVIASMLASLPAAGCSRSPGRAGARSPVAGSLAELDGRAELLTMRGQWDDARRLVERGLAEAHARGDRAGETRLRLRLARTLSDQTWHQGGPRDAARTDLERALREAEAAGEPALVAESCDALGMHRFTQWFASGAPQDLGAADQLFRRALAILAPRGDSGALADVEFHIGLIHQMRGGTVPARQQFERALAIADRIHDDLRRSFTTRHLGYMAELGGDVAAAEAFYRTSLELREKLGMRPGIAAALIALAELRYAHDADAARARAMFERARAVAAQVRSVMFTAEACAAIARILRDQGQYEEALSQLAEQIRVLDQVHSDEGVPAAYEQRALIRLLQDQPLVAAAEAERGIARRSSPRLQALLRLARARSGQAMAAGDDPGDDPVVTARLALARRDASAALDAAIRGDDPDTLLLAAQLAGAEGQVRALAAAAAMSPAQARRFARVVGH